MNRQATLVNPFDMQQDSTTAAPAERTETTAGGHYLHDVHICPACKNPMKKMTVSRRTDPIESWVCLRDRISLPLKNG